MTPDWEIEWDVEVDILLDLLTSEAGYARALVHSFMEAIIAGALTKRHQPDDTDKD